MLDDANVIQQRDPSNMLGSVAGLLEQIVWAPTIKNSSNDGRTITAIVIAGMGGSALGADMFGVLARKSLKVPLQVVKGYDLPAHTSPSTLVITISHSGNTEETLSCYQQARDAGVQIGVIAGGGDLQQRAVVDDVAHVIVPTTGQPRLSTVYHLKALLALLELFGCIDNTLARQITDKHDWLKGHIEQWQPLHPTHQNYAKQLALLAVGKTPVIYSGPLLAPIAYKWKISWNENAKNIAFSNTYPEFNHNEFIGWSSHPVEKPFVIFDLMSSLESDRIAERMELSDRLLSGLRPKANTISMEGDDLVAQYLYGVALADMVTIYVAILNGVKPEPVALVEKLKSSLR